MKHIESSSRVSTRSPAGLTEHLESISDRISGIIDAPELKTNPRFKELLGLIESRVQQKISKIPSPYHDFPTRLTASDTQIKATFHKILLKDWKLAFLYRELTKEYITYLHDPSIQKRLFEEYFEELVYLSLAPKPPKQPQVIMDRDIEEFYREYVSTGKYPPLSKSIRCLYEITKDLDDTILEPFFQQFQKLTILSLNSAGLDTFSKAQLCLLFSNLGSTKCLDLCWNSLFELDSESLGIIFENLGGIKSLNLGHNQLSALPYEKWESVFRHLSHVKHLGLSSIFPCTTPPEVFTQTFQHLAGIPSLDLYLDSMPRMSDAQLQGIFLPLSGAKRIIVRYSPPLKLTLKRLFPDLERKMVYEDR